MKADTAARGARRGRADVCRSIAGEAQSAASAANVIAQNERVSGRPDRPNAGHVIPSQIAAAPPSSKALAPGWP